MNDTSASIPVLIGTGLVQLALFWLITQWLSRRINIHLRWLRICGLVFALCLLWLPYIAVLIWFPPDDPRLCRRIAQSALFTPPFAALIVAYICICGNSDAGEKPNHTKPINPATS